jgi:hypothetical protein
MVPGEAIKGESALPKITKAGRELAPVAGQVQAIGFQGTSS